MRWYVPAFQFQNQCPEKAQWLYRNYKLLCKRYKLQKCKSNDMVEENFNFPILLLKVKRVSLYSL